VKNAITSIEIFECRVPLSKPLDLGNLTFRDRDYTIVRIRDAQGAEGTAWGYSRGADIASTIRRSFAPFLTGGEVEWHEDTWQRLYRLNPFINQGGLFLRALSLVDIGLCELECSRKRLGLSQFLKAKSLSKPVTIACCYPVRGKTVKADVVECRKLVDGGCRSLKVCAADGGAKDTERLRSIRDAVGYDIELKIDLHWLWSTVEEVRSTLRAWEELDLTWIEDPFLAESTDELKRLKESTTLPIAYGDEQNGRHYMSQLISAHCVDFLRLDATVVGGLTEFVRIGREANALGICVSAHLFEEYHASALGVLEKSTNIERFDPNSGLDGINELRRLTPEGSTWDWEAVEYYKATT
jgi:D-arabinonate dehydratase